MTEIQSHESFRNGNQTFDVGMDRLEVVNATRDLSPGERVRFWSTFQSSDEDTYPSVITGKTVDDVSAVLSGSKPATILELEDLEDPSIEELIAREQDRFGLLFVGETVDYYGRTKYFLGKSESVEALSELYRGRGGIESPLPVDEIFIGLLAKL